MIEIHHHGCGQRFIAELLGVAEQPAQQFQGKFGTQAQRGTFAGRRFHPRGFHHPYQPLPASRNCRGALLVFAKLLVVALLLLNQCPVPLGGAAGGEHRDQRQDEHCGQRRGATETRRRQEVARRG
ncbi:hypothetical protein BST12_06260 [Mycobacterium angelicum]|uniref:Uncharacterized protein n=1 Tax=Mycobacterium angelicum TaxID=470074 RepID=A0A1X0A217_MYCAN|nr:hypothetical protein BST12_06260 [Mycobacterium angelicum]